MHIRSSAFTLRAVLGAGLLAGAMLLSGCQNALDGIDDKANVPIPARLQIKMKTKGMTAASPIMVRIFKQENELEIWKQTHTGRYALLDAFEICKWSGKLGPKFKEGDRQAPEGFYNVNKRQMNPKSQYHLAFNIGFPNAYDRAHGRTGTHLMVHGACSSAGCYSMTDERVEEIYALAREAFAGGQKAFQLQAYPFRMTAKNMVANRKSPHFDYWKMLKRGYDHFEITKIPPKVDVCDKRYVFNAVSGSGFFARRACPQMGMPQSLATAFLKREKKYAERFETLLAKSEGRKASDIPAMSYASVLPEFTVIPAVGAVTKAAPKKTVDADAPEAASATRVANDNKTGDMTSAVKAEPAAEPPQKKPLEATLEPAG